MANHNLWKTASCVVFMLLITTGRSDIVVAPNNNEVQIGSSTYFNCSTSITSEEIHWFHYPIGSQDRSFVYSFNQFHPPYLGRFSLEKNETTGEYNLVITCVKAEDAGKYECQDKAGNGTKRSAQLIILGKTEGESDGDSYKSAFIFMCILFLLLLSVTTIGFILMLTKHKVIDNIRDRLTWTTKCIKVSKDEESQQPTTAEELTKAEIKRRNEKAEEPIEVEMPLLSNKSGESNDALKSQIQTMKKNVKTLQYRISQRDEAIKESQQNEKSNNSKIISLQIENKQLQAKVKDLEQHLYPKENIDYKDKPDLEHTIHLSEINKGKPINGITVLGDELFVVTEGSEDLEVYDSKTFHFEGNRKVRGLADPLDITSSKADNYLYVIDRVSADTESKIMRIDPKGNMLHRWSTGGGNGRLSTYESNIILCLFEEQVIIEYSPNGDPIVTVRLSPAAKLNRLWHAIKVTSAHFVVSHGDVDDDLHRVCVVDLDGNIRKECTKWKKSNIRSHTEMKVPICLAVDNGRSILVADSDHNRILLLNSQLKYQGKLVTEEHGLKGFPVRILLGDKQSQLFVAVNKRSVIKKEWKDGHILVFNVK